GCVLVAQRGFTSMIFRCRVARRLPEEGIMIVRVESIFDAPPDKIWKNLLRPTSLVKVAAPMVKILPMPGEDFPEIWQAKQTYRCRSFLYGFVPAGVRTIYLENVDNSTREIQSREHDWLIRRWDHLIMIQPYGENQSLYSDKVEIDAGM